MPSPNDRHEHLNELVTQHTLSPIVGKTFSTGPRPTLAMRERAVQQYVHLHPPAHTLAPPAPPTPPLPPPPPPHLDSIVIDWSPITFSGGTPVGGWAHVVLYPDGRGVFTGHMHDSGTPSYDFSVSFALVSTKGSVFTISHGGTLKGTFDPGSRSDDWTEGSTRGELASAWGELSEGYAWHGSASVNWTLKTTIDNAIEAAKTAAAIGGAVKSIVALF